MNNYLLDRLRADASHLLALAANESRLQHQGMKGHFRELMIDNLLSPWLPPYVACGTGMIIASENQIRASTQDDIILYDRSLVPPILVSSSHAPEGVFLYNSVFARIEIKSTLTREGILDFLRASIDIAKLKYEVQPGFSANLEAAFNLLFAYNSDAAGKSDPDYQVKRLIEVMQEQGIDPLSGIVSMICIPPYGFWKVGIQEDRRCWQRFTPGNEVDRIVWFVACVSNACFLTHARRQGRDPAKGLEGGIGMYLKHPFESVLF